MPSRVHHIKDMAGEWVAHLSGISSVVGRAAHATRGADDSRNSCQRKNGFIPPKTLYLGKSLRGVTRYRGVVDVESVSVRRVTCL